MNKMLARVIQEVLVVASVAVLKTVLSDPEIHDVFVDKPECACEAHDE